MVLPDTKGVSELMRAAPGAKLLALMDALQPRDVFVSAIAQAEVRTGVSQTRLSLDSQRPQLM